MGKFRSGVFESVFYNVRESMGLRYDEEGLQGNAASLYFLEIPIFTPVGEEKVFKNNVRGTYSALSRLYIFLLYSSSAV